MLKVSDGCNINRLEHVKFVICFEMSEGEEVHFFFFFFFFLHENTQHI